MSKHEAPWRTYAEIAGMLRHRIASGAYPTGTRMPSEARLCEEFGVARTTIRRALALLAADRLIASVPGSGRVILDPSQATADADARQGIALPRYQRIARALRNQIEAGELTPDVALPSEAAIVEQYGVSRGTARQALAELERAGLIATIHGKGRFVRRRPQTVEPRPQKSLNSALPSEP